MYPSGGSFNFKDPTREGIRRRFGDVEFKNQLTFSEEVNHTGLIHGRYGVDLLHPLWKAKRNHILERDHYACIHCKNRQDLQVHHRQYHFNEAENKFRKPWDYPDHLLITLCKACNTKGHQLYKVPIIHIQTLPV